MKKSLGMAYAISKKNKMADGGKVNKLKQGAQESRKYDDQKSEKGVHTPRFNYPHNKESHGESHAGYVAKSDSGVSASTGRAVSKTDMNAESKKEHRRVLSEMKAMPKVPKYAQGGPVSAKTEARPMPGHEEMQKNPLPMSKMLDKPTEAQVISNNGRMVKPIKHPSMVQSPVFKVKLRSQEDDLMSSKAPAAPTEQPEHDDNEEGADRQGPPVHKMKMMASGGMINDEVSMHDAEEDEAIHPMSLESDDDQMAPHEEEFMSSKMPAYAEGGRIEPMDEEEMEHYDSMAAAIMAKRDRQAAMSNSEDDSQEHAELPKEDHQEDMPEFAKGGPIKSHPSIYSDDSSEVDLSRNADEDANEEDQLSFNALRKENYDESDALNKLDQPEDSNEHGDEREDRAENKLDKVDRIMSKMSKSKKFK